MTHYVYGLQYMSRTYDRRTGKADSACGKHGKSKRRRIKEFLHTSMSNKKADRFAEDFNAERGEKREEKTLGKVFTVRAGSTLVDARGRDNEGNPYSSSSSGSTHKDSKDRKKAAKNDKKKREYGHNHNHNIGLRNNTTTKKKKNSDRNSTERNAGIQGTKKNSKNIPNKGFHLATDLRLDSALILKLLSLEKVDDATSDDQRKFYSFV
jgi:hypothetical protein